ncbi:MAG: HD-GYP domain-containing protein [Lachnospiraceae bacterium]|nr:HD-GYP domain-containing protein [Lachnospiraceae bacterium]
MREKSKKYGVLIFAGTLAAAILLLIISIVQTNLYNSMRHTSVFSKETLFEEQSAKEYPVSIRAGVRDSTWTKVLDPDNEGLEEHNYQAYTVDFYVENTTKDEVKDFAFKLDFVDNAFLLSAWNGSLQIHQNTDNGEIVDTISDLREFVPEDHVVETFTADGDTLVHMKPGDYLNYIPSSSQNAMEIPIEPHEGTVPGIIMYFPIGDDISNTMSVTFEYTFNRKLTSVPLFWVSQALIAIWLITLIIYLIISIQMRKYNERHERDNKIINESMETFIGFIDAKDPYTNGHSIRVAKYTRILAEALGYKDEELERIYYVALLHDCGKIGVPDHILGKPGKLTDEEFEVIKSHTVRGGEIMSHFKSLENAGEGALYHHERYDGKGYPEGKAGEEIPFIARIICVADSYDAMNTNRVYRDKLSKEHILAEIERCKGKQFDPKIADIMISLIKNDALSTN